MDLIEAAAAPCVVGTAIENQDIPREYTKPIRKTKAYLDTQLSPENPEVDEVVKSFVRKHMATVLNPTASHGEHGQPVPNVVHLVNPTTGFFTLYGLARSAGIYIFTFLIDPTRTYIGSSVALSGRVHGHKREQMEFPNRTFYALVAQYG